MSRSRGSRESNTLSWAPSGAASVTTPRLGPLRHPCRPGAPARALTGGREGRVAATHERQIALEVGDDPSRHERHEVAVSGQLCVDAREGPGRDGSASNVIRALEYQDLATSPAAIGRGGQRVVPGATDDVVVADLATDSRGRGKSSGQRLPGTSLVVVDLLLEGDVDDHLVTLLAGVHDADARARARDLG